MFSISGFRNEAFNYNESGYCEVLADVHKSIFGYLLFQILQSSDLISFCSLVRSKICTDTQPNMFAGNKNIYISGNRYLQGLSKVFVSNYLCAASK